MNKWRLNEQSYRWAMKELDRPVWYMVTESPWARAIWAGFSEAVAFELRPRQTNRIVWWMGPKAHPVPWGGKFQDEFSPSCLPVSIHTLSNVTLLPLTPKVESISLVLISGLALWPALANRMQRLNFPHLTALARLLKIGCPYVYMSVWDSLCSTDHYVCPFPILHCLHHYNFAASLETR